MLHDKLEEASFTRCTTDMCSYFKRSKCDMTIIDVYVDELLETTSSAAMVHELFLSMGTLSIKDLGEVRKFIGMRIDVEKN